MYGLPSIRSVLFFSFLLLGFVYSYLVSLASRRSFLFGLHARSSLHFVSSTLEQSVVGNGVSFDMIS